LLQVAYFRIFKATGTLAVSVSDLNVLVNGSVNSDECSFKTYGWLLSRLVISRSFNNFLPGCRFRLWILPPHLHLFLDLFLYFLHFLFFLLFIDSGLWSAVIQSHFSLIISGCFRMVMFLMFDDGGLMQSWQSYITWKVIQILFVSQVVLSKRDADFPHDVHDAFSSRTLTFANRSEWWQCSVDTTDVQFGL